MRTRNARLTVPTPADRAQASVEPELRVSGPGLGSRWLSFSELWRYRELLRTLVLRNLKIKYQRSALGFLWTLLNPVLMLTLLIAVFSHVVRIPIPHYWAFLVSGYFVWTFVSQALSTGTYVLAQHASMRRSVAFPAEVLILSATGSRLIEFAVELTLVTLALVVFHHGTVPASFALLPVLLALQLLLAVGLMMPIATLSAFYHDVQHALPVSLLFLFYASPIFYPLELVPEQFRTVYLLNPLAGLLTLFHVVLYEGRVPSLDLFLRTFAMAGAIFFVGYQAFNRYKARFVEIV